TRLAQNALGFHDALASLGGIDGLPLDNLMATPVRHDDPSHGCRLLLDKTPAEPAHAGPSRWLPFSLPRSGRLSRRSWELSGPVDAVFPHPYHTGHTYLHCGNSKAIPPA